MFSIPENLCLFSNRTCVSNVVFFTDSKSIFGFSLARQVPGIIINESFKSTENAPIENIHPTRVIP
jgi:hypothetical protein